MFPLRIPRQGGDQGLGLLLRGRLEGPLEAIQNGTPALVSDRGALPEVFGPGEWILPLKRQAWIEVIVRAMSDALFRGNIFEAQRALCERWSWNESADIVWGAVGRANDHTHPQPFP